VRCKLPEQGNRAYRPRPAAPRAALSSICREIEQRKGRLTEHGANGVRGGDGGRVNANTDFERAVLEGPLLESFSDLVLVATHPQFLPILQQH
jgi:hypothetical protein